MEVNTKYQKGDKVYVRKFDSYPRIIDVAKNGLDKYYEKGEIVGLSSIEFHNGNPYREVYLVKLENGVVETFNANDIITLQDSYKFIEEYKKTLEEELKIVNDYLKSNKGKGK